MAIGPEPRTRMRWRSVLRGTGDLPDEVVEELERVVRPRPRLRVVLDAAGGHIEQADALHRAVVEVEARELDGAVIGLATDRRVGQRPLDREAVVLRGDRDPPRAQVLDRVVGAAVA